MSARRRVQVAALAVVAGTVASACDLLLVAPAPPAAEVTVAFALVVDSASGPARAFSRVDRVYLRLITPDSVKRDTVVAVVRQDTLVGARLALLSREQIDALGVYAELRMSAASIAGEANTTGGAALFKGGRIVRVAVGDEPTVVDIEITPVPAELRPSHDGLTLAVGDTVRLSSAVLFASGDTIPDKAGAWSSENPGVVTVSPAGLVLARTLGTTKLIVVFGELEAFVEASVVEAP